ncbi:MAG: DegV family protein [Steroidobacteraceae bacterium]
MAVPEELDGTRLALALRAGIHRLLSREEVINKINVFPVPDGDTGTNLALTLQAVLNALRSGNEPHAGRLLVKAADAALDGARGNSGTILAQFLLGVGDRLGHLAGFDPSSLAAGLVDGAHYAREAMNEPREGTILSVLSAFAEEAARVADRGEQDFRSLFSAALVRARESLEATRGQLEVLRKAGVVDAGALGFVELVTGMSEYLETGEVPADDVALKVVHEEGSTAGEESDLQHRYCTECLVQGEGIDRRRLRERLGGMGSSLVIAGSARKVRIHIHVNEPTEVFAIAAGFGEVTGRKADDMQRQQGIAHHLRDRRVGIVVDSAADLPEALLEHHDIFMVPVRVHFGEQSYLDKVGLTPEEFFGKLASGGAHPKTSLPPPGDFRRAFEFLGSHYEAVLYVGLTSRASGTFNAAEAAARRTTTHGTLRCLDSRNASLGQGLIALAAAQAAEAGGSLEQVSAAAESAVLRTRTFACVQTLDYAIRGGRVPAWAGRVASWFKLMPIIATRPDGRVSLGGVLFHSRDLTPRFARFIGRRLRGGARWRLAIGHANAPDEADRLRGMLERAHGARLELLEIIPIGTALGVHGGPGCLVVSMQELT